MTLTEMINELALKYAGGDKSAAEELYKLSKHVVTGYLYTARSNVLETDAEDVFEDAFLAGLETLGKKAGRPDKSFEAAVITAANRRYLDLIKDNYRCIRIRPAAQEDEENRLMDKADIERIKSKYAAENPADAEIVRDMANEMLSAVQNLENDAQRNVLVGRLMFQKRGKELADVFDRNESEIKSDLRNGLIRLAGELDKKGIERENYAGFGWLIARKMYHCGPDLEMVEDCRLRGILQWIEEGKSKPEITELLGVSEQETARIIRKAIAKFGKLHIKRISAAPAKMTAKAEIEWLWKMSDNKIHATAIYAKTKKSISASAQCLELAALAWFTCAVAGIFDGGWKQTLGEIVSYKLRELTGKELTELCRRHEIDPVLFGAVLSDTFDKSDITEELKTKICESAGIEKKDLDSALE